MTGIPTNSTTPIAHLADTGANCCLCHDESILVGVHSITPVSIGVATTPDQKSDISYCTRMGYLPLPRTDNTNHMQLFYCTPKASGVIMSPECIMNTSPDIVKWTQTGHRDKNKSGQLVFTDSNNIVVLTLNLHKKDGL